MVVVTDKKYYMDNALVAKLDLMAYRFEQKLDNVILIDGDEGTGKSNMAAGICYYLAWKTGRKFNVDNIFFDIGEAIEFAKNTSEQIIDWDEGALGGLAAEWWKKNQIEFIKLLMIARKKKHLFVICIPKFFKLNEYLVVDRSIALVHVYAKNEIERGRFVYYGKAKKEKLFLNWRKTKQRNYKRYYDFRGKFLEYLPKVVDEDLYEAKKDKAILNFRKEKDNLTDAAREKVKRQYQGEVLAAFLKQFPDIPKVTLAKTLNIPHQVVSRRLRAHSLDTTADTKTNH